MADWILLLNLVVTLLMTGVIWFVQVVHYPLFLKVGSVDFSKYESSHRIRTSFVVVPLMLVEGVSSVALLVWPPGGFAALWLWILVALLVVIWLSTFLIQVPLHNRLSNGFRDELIRKLVRSNWVRTAGWTLRSVALVVLTFSQFEFRS